MSSFVAEFETNTTATTVQTKYLTQDHLGSPRIITNQSGAVVSRHDYRAFGEEVYAGTANRTNAQGYGQADGIRQQYTGYERDYESGLDFAQARYYNSQHGRFTSVDPLTSSANVKDPQTFNRYSYVLNSPYKFTDPLGLLAGGYKGVNYGLGCDVMYSSCSNESWEGGGFFEELPPLEEENDGTYNPSDFESDFSFKGEYFELGDGKFEWFLLFHKDLKDALSKIGQDASRLSQAAKANLELAKQETMAFLKGLKENGVISTSVYNKAVIEMKNNALIVPSGVSEGKIVSNSTIGSSTGSIGKSDHPATLSYVNPGASTARKANNQFRQLKKLESTGKGNSRRNNFIKRFEGIEVTFEREDMASKPGNLPKSALGILYDSAVYWGKTGEKGNPHLKKE